MLISDVQAIRCPSCGACLAEVRDGFVVVDILTGHGSRFKRSIVGAVEIRCGRNLKDGPCSGVWRALS